VALWRVAQEAVAVGVAEGEGIAVVVLWAAQRLSRCDPCPGGAEQVARGHGYCGAAAPPMRVVAQGGGHRNGVNIGQEQSNISHRRSH
jgi:hypothetical protein